MRWRKKEAEGREERGNAISDSVTWGHPQSSEIWKPWAIKGSQEPPQQKEKNTQRLGRRPEGLESGGRNVGQDKSGQGTTVPRDSSVPASGAQCSPSSLNHPVPTAGIWPKGHPKHPLTVVVQVQFYHGIQIQRPLSRCSSTCSPHHDLVPVMCSVSSFPRPNPGNQTA